MNSELTLWQNYAACWSADLDTRPGALALVAVDDVAYRDPGTETNGLAELAGYMEGFTGAFPGHHFRIDEVTAHHGRSLARWAQVDQDGTTVAAGASIALHRDGRLADVTGFFPLA